MKMQKNSNNNHNNNHNKYIEIYLEEIMNYRMFKVFQGHVIAHINVLVGHSLLKPFPSKTFIFKKIHRNASGRFGQNSFNKLGWSSFSKDG